MLPWRGRREFWSVPILDLGLATVLLVTSLGAILTGEVHEGATTITIPVAVVSSLAMVLRTRATIVATVVVCAAEVFQALLGTNYPGTIMALAIMLILSYSVAAEHDEGLAAAGLALLLLTGFFEEWHQGGSDYPFLALELGGVWLLGRAARSLRSRATFAEQHQQDVARLEVAQERARIARELHDVVAHALSVIAVQADAAEAALLQDPDRATEPMRAIRGSARQALSDMRQLLNVLRADGIDPTDAQALRPAHGVDDLQDLVEGMRSAGLPLDASIRMRPDVPPGIGLALYRITQEALTNVLKHAGQVPTELIVEDDGRLLRVVVRNALDSKTPEGSLSSGQGLVGVRERAHAAGGTMQAGRTRDGRFELIATLQTHRNQTDRNQIDRNRIDRNRTNPASGQVVAS